MKVVQVDLVRNTVLGIATKTSWVEDRPELKVGVVIKLKNKVGDWTVTQIYKDENSFNEFDWLLIL